MRIGRSAIGILAMTLLAACTGGGGSPRGEAAAAPELPAGDGPVITVYASPDCGCCHEYIPYLEEHGYRVETVPVTDVTGTKVDLGIPEEAWSCHTAVVGDYVVEGHVPVEAIDELLAERPRIDGIALPGMPPGSPGMDGEKTEPFLIVAIDGGKIKPFMTI